MLLDKKTNNKENKHIFNKILSIDFETPNSFHDTACSMGISLFENGIITSKEFLINPESHFDDTNISIHNITEDMIKDSPTFPHIWEEISNLIDDNTLVIAHNANFDMSVLRKLALKYNLTSKNFNYTCTHDAYKKNRELPSYKLNSIASTLNLDFNHHNAGDDALICLKIFINLLGESIDLSHEFLENNLNLVINTFSIYEKPKAPSTYYNNFFKKKTFKASDITTSNTDFDITHPVYDKTFVVTGDLINISLKEAAQNIVDLGGHYKDSVVKATNFLIIGTNLQNNSPSIGTTKYKKAKEKYLKGDNIKLINEDEFLTLIGYKKEISNSDIEDNALGIKENTPIEIVKENIETVTKKEESEFTVSHLKPNENSLTNDFTQIGFDFSSMNDDTKDHSLNSHVNINNTIVEEASLTTVENQYSGFIAPKGSWQKFENDNEKIEKLKQFKLISAKSTIINKTFYYKGVFSHSNVLCNILGFLQEDVLVIEVQGSLHCIRGEYLKQMQESTFNNIPALTE